MVIIGSLVGPKQEDSGVPVVCRLLGNNPADRRSEVGVVAAKRGYRNFDGELAEIPCQFNRSMQHHLIS
jgi:hypothetical protein